MQDTYTNDRVTFTGTLDDMVDRGIHARKLGKYNKGASQLASRRTEQGPTSETWSGTNKWTDAVDLARNGWSDGAQRIASLRDTLQERIGELLPETVYMMDVTGFDVDVGAYLSGEPECMVTTAEMQGSSRQVHVAINISSSSFVSPETMTMRGLLAAGIVDTLENMGHRVTLDVVVPTEYDHPDGKGECNIIVNLKDAQDALDIERVAFACAHPSMLRRLSFAVKESLPYEWRVGTAVESGGYGRPVDDVTWVFPDEQPDIYIGNANDAKNMEEVVDQVIQYLRDCDALQ